MSKFNTTYRKYVYVITLLLIQQLSLKAQSSEYTIESFQGEYIELTSYQSVALLTDFDPLWEYEFDLEFPFPFYDSIYTRMIYNHSGWGSFTDEQDEALFLMEYNWTYEEFMDTSNIPSDVRFSHVEVDGMKAFVMQFTKARFFADPYKDILDTYLNFQYWFYENGVIEVHFGEIHMDNTPIYAPGKGFYIYTTDEGVDTTEIAGPHMGISHPFDESNAIGLQGAYNDYEVVGSNYSILTVLPPHGWVIRFKPTFVSTSTPEQEHEQLVISPNPANEYVNLPVIGGKVLVIDGTGSIVFEGYPQEDVLDISFFPTGLYYLQIITGEKISIGKFIRQ